MMDANANLLQGFAGRMAFRKNASCGDPGSVIIKPLRLSSKVSGAAQVADCEAAQIVEPDVEIDLREVYFLIMHFLSVGPCQNAFGQLRNELLEHQLLPRRYHAWYSRSGLHSRDENDDGASFPLTYAKLVERYPHVKNDHLIKLLKELVVSQASPSRDVGGGRTPNAADVPTLLGTGSFSLLSYDKERGKNDTEHLPAHMLWPHRHADQVRGLSLREIGGGFAKHHRAPSIRASCYAIAKPSTMVQKMQNIKRLRGHRNAVYCAIFDRSGRYVITGSDDRLVKIWSMETAYCLASCRGHEGDITDLAVSSNNTFVASSSNDCIIRIWRLPDGLPVSVLRGHTGAVTAIAFNPRPGSPYQLLSSSDDGTCRIWDARGSQFSPRIYAPRPTDSANGRSNGPSSSNVQQTHQIFCCAFNSNGTIFVTGSSDTLARVWNACKSNMDDSDQPNHELDVLAGHENDVNYVQFSGCAVGSRFAVADFSKEENVPKFKNSWFYHDNIVTCSRDGSAIIWIPRSRRSHVKNCRWTRAYHLKVPPPPIPPQPPRGGPRQRILPTPRGVNMIVWSLDNRFVLAAIMDCRICVWNASDGSLVHSLTGHTQSTYVLDVHPFNPRIAMSAGYDGKTIVWDIWEGMPIQIYEISRFKLVDGKFSPDGTSIILSDDVGQLYILSTGQGDSQKDAKYDQFYLGDYRPLIQDTYGNVLDQETQLAPYRRNMEDPLCDSGMIPYLEPYQTMFQQRRLGALGKEWHPSTLRLAIGPDITLDQDYQMPPLADLDFMIEPLPEFVDTMEWEPENTVLSDDTDSEYNAAEEYSSGGEQRVLNSTSSSEAECSAEESEEEDTHQDGLRRSKRKNPKSEIEVLTSSGRRVKRRNLDEYGGPSTSNARPRKSRNGQKEAKKKSSKSKSSRPRRAAARNALSWFSKITGTSKDAEEADDDSEDDSSESFVQDSDIECNEPNERSKHAKGKEVLLIDPDVDRYHDRPESQNAVNRRRLVLKLPIRDPNKLIQMEKNISEDDEQDELVGSCSNCPRVITEKGNIAGSSNLQLLDKFDKHMDLSEGYGDCKIKWGGVRARTSARLRISEPATLSHTYGAFRVSKLENQNKITAQIKIQEDGDTQESNQRPNGRDQCALNICKDPNEAPKGTDMLADVSTSKIHSQNGPNLLPELKESLPPISTKLRLRSKRVSRDHDSGVCDELQCSSLDVNGDAASDLLKDNGSDRVDLTNGGDNMQESVALISGDLASALPVLVGSQARSKKMYDVVYRRSRRKHILEGNGGSTQCSNSNSLNHDCCMGVNNEEGSDGVLKARIDGVEGSTADASRRSEKVQESNGSARDTENFLGATPNEEWGPGSRMSVGPRSTRNRRPSNHFNDISTTERRKSHQLSGKVSWLTLSTHEEGLRYIPQKGDEIVYLRQGHQEYLEFSSRREVGPWSSIKGNIRPVEFCKVEALDYSTLPGSGDSCCKMIIRFVDPTSSVFNKSFKLTLPEVVSFPDFLVEKSRYNAAVRRNWTCRDKCRVWWKNEGEEDGSWWEGRILSVKPKSAEFPDSPWERYQVKYKSDPTETHLHSPWELFDADTQWEQPHVDDVARQKLLSAFAKLDKSGDRAQDMYGVWKLKQAMQKSSYHNRFPVPLSLELIQCRLENNYYRSLEAIEHDVSVMLSNAESYFARNAELTAKIKRLSEWFARTLSSL